MKQAATGGELKSERQSPEFFFFRVVSGNDGVPLVLAFLSSGSKRVAT